MWDSVEREEFIDRTCVKENKKMFPTHNALFIIRMCLMEKNKRLEANDSLALLGKRMCMRQRRFAFLQAWSLGVRGKHNNVYDVCLTIISHPNRGSTINLVSLQSPHPYTSIHFVHMYTCIGMNEVHKTKYNGVQIDLLVRKKMLKKQFVNWIETVLRLRPVSTHHNDICQRLHSA